MNKSFFNKDLFGNELKSIKKSKAVRKNKSIKKEYSQEELCEKCQLYKTCLSPKMDCTGKGKKEILVLGECAGSNEDREGIQFIGEAGKTLREILEEINIDLDIDCWKVNVVRCRPEKNRTPSTQEINYCKGNLLRTIDELKPKKIITLGKIALQSLIGEKESITSLEQWVGWEIPDSEYQCFIYPNYHPQYLNYNKNDEILRKKFKLNLYNAFYSNRKFKEYKPEVKICDEEESTKYLYNLGSLKSEIISIDVETSGLKGHKEGHFIYSCSITQSNMFTFVFLLTDKNKEYLIKVLENNNIGKVIANCQFEFKWFKQIFNIETKNIIWDSQQTTHILDNRSKITSLKFQTYVNFGISDYSQNIKKYLQAKEKGGNSFNRIKDAPIDKLLKYNGYDSYFTMLLYKKQKGQLDDHLMKGNDFFLESDIEMAQYGGIKFDYNLYEKNYNELTNKIDELDKKIMNSKEINLLDNEENHFYVGKTLITKENFNYNSDKQLRELLFNICKWKPIKETGKNNYSVDAEVLLKFNRKFTNNIIERKKLLKLRDTYLEQFKREAVEKNNEWFIYPNFSLNIPVSYRSSAQMPSFQNIPVRDEIAKRITRGCLIPREGNFLLELDGKQMEVGTGCCYHFDPVMIDYVTQGKDMHKDLTKQLLFRNENNFIKKERNIVKGDFVFAEFYGSTARLYDEGLKKRGYGDVTFGLWDNIFDFTKEHLRLNGINSIYDFQKHVEEIENDFWNRRFKVYQQWKFDNWREYKEKGYIELYTGFRCTSRMSFNDVNNYRVQGTAYHIAQRVLNKVSQFLRKKKFKTVILGEVHDSGLLDVYPPEFNDLIEIIELKIKEVQNEWSWIIVPLKFEYAVTKINESWDKKKDLEI